MDYWARQHLRMRAGRATRERKRAAARAKREGMRAMSPEIGARVERALAAALVEMVDGLTAWERQLGERIERALTRM